MESVIRRVRTFVQSGTHGQQSDMELLVAHLDALREENKNIRKESETKAMAQVAEACLTMLKVKSPQELRDILEK